ncbi:type VI secretion system protein TssA [Alkalimarinus coralli]|uniref:type VI secretion system protein TssA n=1 Tax=Alkalimarinus coralli TaxID=2935863 RepID=UPI00202B61C3|nr:type VI secretion system protein TssA [Alkalimarinus coralli]
MLSLTQWRDGALSPVDKKCPVGNSARLSDEFDKLQLEVSNELALDSDPTDWGAVLNLSHEILSSQSKDLLVLVYSIRALVDSYRYEGLSESLTLLKDYIQLYWVESFPPLKRKRARVSALEWLAQQLEVWVDSNKPDQKERSALEEVLSATKVVDQCLSELEGEWSLDLFIMKRKLNAYLAELPEEQEGLIAGVQEGLAADSVLDSKSNAAPTPHQADVVPIVPPQTASESSTTHTNVSAGSPNLSDAKAIIAPLAQAEIADEKSYAQSVRTIQSSLKQLARYRLSKNIADARAYEINRFGMWLPVSELPINQDGLTPLRSIPAEKRHLFHTLFEQTQYEVLIVELESSLSSSPFWLDGHRMVVDSLKAMEALSENSRNRRDYQRPIETVSRLVKSFVTRLEGIETLKFSDESPFANDETRSWLSSVEEFAAGSAPNFVNNSTHLSLASDRHDATDFSEEGNAEAKIIEESNKACKNGGFSDGLSIIDQHCRRQTNKKEWFNARLLMVDYCFSAKDFALAEQILIELDETCVDHSLDQWLPDMVSEMLSKMLVCKSKLKRKNQLDGYYQRLVRINVMQGHEMKSFAS